MIGESRKYYMMDLDQTICKLAYSKEQYNAHLIKRVCAQ